MLCPTVVFIRLHVSILDTFSLLKKILLFIISVLILILWTHNNNKKILQKFCLPQLIHSHFLVTIPLLDISNLFLTCDKDDQFICYFRIFLYLPLTKLICKHSQHMSCVTKVYSKTTLSKNLAI